MARVRVFNSNQPTRQDVGNVQAIDRWSAANGRGTPAQIEPNISIHCRVGNERALEEAVPDAHHPSTHRLHAADLSNSILQTKSEPAALGAVVR
jgi:hypothetical protein